VCDACFSMKTPFTQYHTRQTVRSTHLLEDSTCLDCFSSCCCTPCAVAQDALELERRGPSAAPAPPAMQIVVAEGTQIVLPTETTKAAPPAYAQVPLQMQV
jgi:hypothetical protein